MSWRTIDGRQLMPRNGFEPGGRDLSQQMFVERLLYARCQGGRVGGDGDTAVSSRELALELSVWLCPACIQKSR